MTAVVTDIEARVPYQWEDREPLLELDLPIEEYQHRIARIQAELDRGRLDGLVVYGAVGQESNARFLSGFSALWGTMLVMVPRRGEPVLITNAIFHGEPMHSNVQTTWIKDLRPLKNSHHTGTPMSVVDLGTGVLNEWGALNGKLAFADLSMIPVRVAEDIRKQWAHATLVDGLDLLLKMRRIKTPAEIVVIRKLAEATSAGMNAGLAAAKAGATESGVAAAVHAGCVAAGAERMVYGCLTSAGPRSSMKNIFPRPDKVIETDELVVIDVGAKLGGYQSDMSRNAVAGRATDEVRRLLEACLEAEEFGLKATMPGVPVVSVVAAMKEVIAKRGSAEWDWTTGHGFGLDLVEEPHFHPTNTALLEPGMCFYIEPMIVPTSIGTICFEDMVLVTETGCEQLTSSPKKVWD